MPNLRRRHFFFQSSSIYGLVKGLPKKTKDQIWCYFNPCHNGNDYHYHWFILADRRYRPLSNLNWVLHKLTCLHKVIKIVELNPANLLKKFWVHKCNRSWYVLFSYLPFLAVSVISFLVFVLLFLWSCG